MFAFGDVAFLGSMGGVQLNAPLVGIEPAPAPVRCAEWPPEHIPPDLRVSLTTSATRWASDEEAIFTLALENHGGQPAYIIGVSMGLFDADGTQVWQQGRCAPAHPAVFFGWWRLSPNETFSSSARYPTFKSYEAECEFRRVDPGVDPGSYQLVGTVRWCATAHDMGPGWACDEPSITQIERGPTVQVEAPSPS